MLLLLKRIILASLRTDPTKVHTQSSKDFSVQPIFSNTVRTGLRLGVPVICLVVASSSDVIEVRIIAGQTRTPQSALLEKLRNHLCLVYGRTLIGNKTVLNSGKLHQMVQHFDTPVAIVQCARWKEEKNRSSLFDIKSLIEEMGCLTVEPCILGRTSLKITVV